MNAVSAYVSAVAALAELLATGLWIVVVGYAALAVIRLWERTR